MARSASSLLWICVCVTLLTPALSLPLPDESPDNATKTKEAVLESLKNDLLTAAALGGLAEAVREEQKFEEEILVTAVNTLTRDKGDKVKQAKDMGMLQELVTRDKRAVELLTSVLGGSSGGGGSGGGGGGGNLISGLLGSSSGGGGEGEDGGGGSNILSLLTGILGSSSGGGASGGGDGEEGGAGGGGGGSNLLSLIPSLLGSSSGGGGGGNDAEGADAGGGSNILSLLTGVLGSSSGGGESSGSFKPLGTGLDSKINLFNVGGGADILAGGTYDDLIGKGGGGDLIGTVTNTVSKALRVKFNVFKSLFSSLTGNLLGGGASAASKAAT